MESAWPKQPKPPPKRGSRLDAYRDVIDAWLRDDLDAPRKQRHTAKPRLSPIQYDHINFLGRYAFSRADVAGGLRPFHDGAHESS
ncbi:hypothetical protein [Nonomuraea sp. NPDC003709]|uniref:hypothetical protein n=1 Tax=Nonomuraea sp. NPDC003709 TaxID=3154450 RepID=UPI0033B837F6